MLNRKVNRETLQRLNLLVILLWLMLIIYSCLFPTDKLPSNNWNIPHMDKLGHFVFYFGLVHLTLIYRLLMKWHSFATGFIIFFILLLGIAIEYLQQLMGMGRTFSVEDMLANMLGLIFGIVFFYWLEHFYFKVYQKLTISES